MSASQAVVATSHASRYLTQLCKHWSHKFAVAFTPEHGEVLFAPDRSCNFRATPTELVIQVRTPDEAMQTRMQEVVIKHLQRFAFRENLGVIAWTGLPDADHAPRVGSS